VTVEDPVQME